MPTLREVLPGITAGAAVTVENLTVVPLEYAGEPVPATDYILAAGAFDRGVLKVAEVHAAGVVAELLEVLR